MVMSDLSARRVTSSATSSALMVSSAHTTRAAARSHPPVNDGQAVEDSPLVVEQQVVAPVDDGSQGLLAGTGRAGAAVQYPEPIVETDRELGQGHRAQP